MNKKLQGRLKKIRNAKEKHQVDELPAYKPIGKEFKPLDRKGRETLISLLMTGDFKKTCKELELTRNGLYKRIYTYGLTDIIDEIPTKAILALKTGSIIAAEELVSELSERGVNARNKAANDILDRVGIGSKVNTAIQVNVTPILGDTPLNITPQTTAQNVDCATLNAEPTEAQKGMDEGTKTGGGSDVV